MRYVALALHGGSLIALGIWTARLSGPPRSVAIGFVLATGAAIGYALLTQARAALQRSALLLVLYVGLATLEVVATQRANHAATATVYTSLATLGFVLAMLRRVPPSHRGSTE